MEIRRAANWGTEWQGNIFACQFNLRKVSRHILQKSGATFSTTDTDFVVSDQADFHPTDAVESPDGSLLIADTGGWYKLCCPTSQLHKPDVLGAIFRVRKTGAVPLKPRDVPIDWANTNAQELAKLLADSRPSVVDRVIAALAKIGDAAVTETATWLNSPRPGLNAAPVHARLNAIWTLTRIPGENARAAIRFAFSDGDPAVRVAACQSAALWRDRGAIEALINHVKHADLHVRRAAVEALGRIGDGRAALPITTAVLASNDRFLEHSCAYAFMELRAADAARSALGKNDAATTRASLAALHDLGELRPEELVAQLSSSDAATARLALWIAGQHSDWGSVLAGWVKERIAAAQSGDLPSLQNLLSKLATSPAVQGYIAELASSPSTAPGRNAIVALGAMRDSGLKQLPEAWKNAITLALGSPSDGTPIALEVVRAFAAQKDFPKEIRENLERLANDPSASTSLRLAAFGAVPEKSKRVSTELFSLFMKEVRSGDLLRARAAAGQLARVDLTAGQVAEIAEALPMATSSVLPALLEVFRSRRDEASSTALLSQLSKLPAPPSAIVRSVLAAHPENVRAAAEALLSKSAAPSASGRLSELAALLPQGDVRRGHLLFQNPRSACSTCHAMAYTGGTLGPDLTKIGAARNERDLLEAIIFPSLSFVRSYEPMIVKTRGGADHLGIVKKEDNSEVVLATGPQLETRIPRADIVAMDPAPISLMPQGYDGIFTPQELADLVAFLKASK
jgi:putative heme-binding domain-containing protein